MSVNAISFFSHVVGSQSIRECMANSSISLLSKLSLKLESAQLHWSEGAVDAAIRTAKHVVQCVHSIYTNGDPQEFTSSIHRNEIVKLLVDSSCLAAEWMSRSRSESSTVIQRYLNQSSDVIRSLDAPQPFVAQLHHRCYYQLGCFMDRTFQSLFAKSQSVEHEASMTLFRSNDEKIKNLTASMSDPQIQLLLRSRDLTDEKAVAARAVYQSKQNYINRLIKEHAVDEKQKLQFEHSLSHALEQAMINYAQCLIHGDRYDTEIIYRLIALWFNHYANTPCQSTFMNVM